MKNGLKIVLFICAMLVMLACSNPAQEYIKQGLSYRDQEKWDEAIAAYTKAIEVDHKSANAYNNRGYAYFQKANIEAAIADFTKAIELAPKETAPYKNRAWSYVNITEYDKAIADIEKVIELSKDAAEIQLMKQAIEALNEKKQMQPLPEIQVPTK